MECQSSLLPTPGFENFQDYLNARPDLSDSTKTNYNNIVKNFKRLGYQPTIEDFARYISKHNRYMTKAALKYYAKFKKDKNLVADLQDIKVKTPEPKPRELTTYDEMMKVIKELKTEDRLIALFTLYTGCRISEPFNILREDLHDDGKVIIRSAKTNKWREVYLPDEFARELLSWLNNTHGRLNKEYIFYTNLKGSTRGKSKWFDTKLQRKAVRLIGKNIPTHDFRRFCATFLYEKTRDIQLVKRILGHASIDTTYKYTQYADRGQDLKRSKQLLSELQPQRNTPGTEQASE